MHSMDLQDDSFEDLPDFPAELDEFLEYSVGEHHGDFEAVSADFLDIASELEEPLVGRAHQVFSPAALKQRWQSLCCHNSTSGLIDPKPAPEQEAQSDQPCQNTTIEDKPDSLPRFDIVHPHCNAGALVADTDISNQPSGFSVLNDSLKDKIDRIYADMQDRLPSSLTADDDDDESEEDFDALGSAQTIGQAFRDIARKEGAAGSKVHPGEIRDHSHHIALKVGSDDIDDGEPDASLEGSNLNFNTILLSRGINPLDIEGPLIETSAPCTPNNPGSGKVTARPSVQPATQANHQSPGSHALPCANGLHQADPWPARSMRTVSKIDHAHSSEVDDVNESPAASSVASDDSGQEDFARIRQAMKNTSLEMANARSPGSTSSSPTNRSINMSLARGASSQFSAGQEVTRSEQKKVEPSAASKPSKFVKLTLEEDSGSSESEGETELDKETESGQSEEEAHYEQDEFGEDPEAEPIRVIMRLMSKSKDGECSWDVWLDATYAWPRLHVALGSPNFVRRAGSLRVMFDQAGLQSLLDQQKQVYAEKCRANAEREERLKKGAADFVREAERRRELLHQRMGGGFVLNSSVPDLQRAHAKLERAHQKVAAAAVVAEESKQECSKATEQHSSRISGPEHRSTCSHEEVTEKQADNHQAIAIVEAHDKLLQQQDGQLSSVEVCVDDIQKEAAKHRFSLFDQKISVGPPLSGTSLEARPFLDDSQPERAPKRFELYMIPWGTVGPKVGIPSAGQCELLSILHAETVAAALVLAPLHDFNIADLPAAVQGYSACVFVLVDSVLFAETRLQDQYFSCGRAISDIMYGPCYAQQLFQVFTRPFAFWALEPDCALESSAPDKDSCDATVETVCIALRVGQTHVVKTFLETMLKELAEEGLGIIGMRLAFPDESAIRTIPTVALKSVVKANQPVLLIAVRGPHALGIWRSLVGPSYPQLARRTDGGSLNARFGGQSRTECVAVPPPLTSAKAYADVIWAFGGRVQNEPGVASLAVLHALALAPTKMYSLHISGGLNFDTLGSVLSGLSLRAGKILSVIPESAGRGGLVATAVREGGEAFLESCSRLLTPPPADLCSSDGMRSQSSPLARTNGNPCERIANLSIAALPCEPPPGKGLFLGVTHNASSASMKTCEDVFHFGEPEVLIIGLRPKTVLAPVLHGLLGGLFERYGPSGSAEQDRPPSLNVGGSVDLVSLRMLDMGACRVSYAAEDEDDTQNSSNHQQALSAGTAALSEFLSFPQVARHTGNEATQEWWLPPAGAGPVTLLCLRGGGLISKFRNFLVHDWSFQAAVSGDVLFSPTVVVSQTVYRIFFGNLMNPCITPTVPINDIRSIHRFQSELDAPREQEDISEQVLFPSQEAAQVTVAVLLPPAVDAMFGRLLATVEHQNFKVVTVIMGGRLETEAAKFLFEQEVADRHLDAGDWDAFCDATGNGEASVDEENFKAIWVMLERHHAVKRLAQLCGHGDPAVNQRHLHVGLRCGRDRIQNGLLCASSCFAAQELRRFVTRHLSPKMVPPSVSEGRRLGVEASMQALECSLVALVVVKHTEVSVARALLEMCNSVSDQGLSIVNLRFVPLHRGHLPSSEQPTGLLESLLDWCKMRPTAAGISQRAEESCPAILAVCEGLLGAQRARWALTTVMSRLPKSCLDSYTSAGSGEGAADVVHHFDELFCAKHYVVESVP